MVSLGIGSSPWTDGLQGSPIRKDLTFSHIKANGSALFYKYDNNRI